MRTNNNGCFTALVTGFSRILLLFFWIARPVQFNAAFGTFIIPCLGFLFLPFTTLMYVFLWTPAGLSGLDWLWIILAVVLDISSIGMSAASNRDRLPAGVPGSTQGS